MILFINLQLGIKSLALTLLSFSIYWIVKKLLSLLILPFFTQSIQVQRNVRFHNLKLWLINVLAVLIIAMNIDLYFFTNTQSTSPYETLHKNSFNAKSPLEGTTLPLRAGQIVVKDGQTFTLIDEYKFKHLDINPYQMIESKGKSFYLVRTQKP